jgi:Ca2+-binding EF-hand superfamily protein
MTSGRLSQNDIDHIFSVFDADKSGSISTEEYRTALIALGHGKVTSTEAATMMGGRATLTKDEFTETIRAHAEQPNSMAEARRAFKIFDPKGTGRLTTDLILKAGLAATGSTPSLDLVNRIMNACDQDGDGVLDFDEFVAAVTLKLKLTPDPPKVAAASPTSAASPSKNADEDATEDDESTTTPEKPAAITPVVAAANGGQIIKILGKDVAFDKNGRLDTTAARVGLLLFGYPEDVLSTEALKDLFDEQDKDADGFINEEEFKELLTALGEY